MNFVNLSFWKLFYEFKTKSQKCSAVLGKGYFEITLFPNVTASPKLNSLSEEGDKLTKEGTKKKKTNTGTAKKSSTSRRKSTAPKSSGNQKKARAEAEYELRRNRFIKGIVIFCFAILCTLLFFFRGEKVWLALHECYRGIFGYFGFMVPIINIYCAFQMMKEKSTYRFPLKVFFFCGTVILLSSTIFAFGSSGMELEDYGTELINCFREASQYKGTGFIGGFLGIPFAKILGAVGGGLVLLLIFAFFLYMSFEAIFMNLIDRIRKPVNERITDRKEIKSRIREQENIIRSEQRKKAREEYVERKVQKHMEAEKRRAADSEYRRIKKPPIYEPDIGENKETKVSRTSNASKAENTINSKGIENIVPEIKPKRKKKEQKKTETPDMEYISGETNIFADTIDISALLKKGSESTEQGGFDPVNDMIPPVFNTPSSPAPDKSVEKKPSKPEKKQEEKYLISPSELTEFDKIDTSAVEGNYLKPPFTLLEPQPEDIEDDISQELHQSAAKLVETLKSFGVQTTITNISRGPSVTRYELQPASGVKISKITNLADDIAMNLAATGVRIEAPIPGKNAVGIEVPNRNISVVKMRGLVESREFQNAKSKLTVALGMDITGKITLADLAKMPHLLIAGSTGSGKSVCINSMLVSLLYKSDPDEVKFMLIDPKVVELGVYNGIPHLLVPVVTDPRKAAGALNWAVNEMLERYKTFAEYNVRDMQGYNRLVDKQNAEYDEQHEAEENERTFEEDEMLAQAQSELNSEDTESKKTRKLEKMCQIVIVIDELADLMMAAPKEVEESICRLAQMARAAGMHLVIATQRPSVDVITGLIKANVPSRIAFAVKSQIDSRTILDFGGAEKLLGRGDMLFSPIGTTKPVRVQGCFVDDNEIENIINFIKKNKVVEYDKNVIDEIERNSLPENNNSATESDSGDTDPMMEQAIKCVVEAGQASTSLLQRRLRLGYARAGRLIDEMEQMGIVGPHEGSKPRQVLITYQQWLERNMTISENS